MAAVNVATRRHARVATASGEGDLDVLSTSFDFTFAIAAEWTCIMFVEFGVVVVSRHGRRNKRIYTAWAAEDSDTLATVAVKVARALRGK